MLRRKALLNVGSKGDCRTRRVSFLLGESIFLDLTEHFTSLEPKNP